MPTLGTHTIVLTVGTTTPGAVTTVGAIRGDGIVLIIGIIVATIPGGVGTDITTPFITMLGIHTMEVITTIIITPRARNYTVARRQATAVTAPVQNEAHALLQIVHQKLTAPPDTTENRFQPTEEMLQRTIKRYLPIAIHVGHPQRFHPAEQSVHSA